MTSFKDISFSTLFSIFCFITLSVAVYYEHGRLRSLEKELSTLTTTLISARSEISSTTVALTTSQSELDRIKNTLGDVSRETEGLSTTLLDTKQNIDQVKLQVGGVERYVGSISGAVDTLEKLSKIDPELLKKYSKVFFLSENYVPAHLITLPSSYSYTTTRSEQFISEAWPHLKTMIDTAESQGVTLFVKSGYRSFAEQKSLKSSYSVIYGKGTANTFSAEQGYSEHQLGSTVDFITTGINGKLSSFDTTSAYLWLENNAHRFGFTLSYPKGNAYYIYEPWHWRFVGVKLATYLHTNGKNFYDLDQRTIDTYLVSLFD